MIICRHVQWIAENCGRHWWLCRGFGHYAGYTWLNAANNAMFDQINQKTKSIGRQRIQQ